MVNSIVCVNLVWIAIKILFFYLILCCVIFPSWISRCERCSSCACSDFRPPARISVESGASFRPSSREVLFPFRVPHARQIHRPVSFFRLIFPSRVGLLICFCRSYFRSVSRCVVHTRVSSIFFVAPVLAPPSDFSSVPVSPVIPTGAASVDTKIFPCLAFRESFPVLPCSPAASYLVPASDPWVCWALVLLSRSTRWSPRQEEPD
jgi:hypothetical protein